MSTLNDLLNSDKSLWQEFHINSGAYSFNLDSSNSRLNNAVSFNAADKINLKSNSTKEFLPLSEVIDRRSSKRDMKLKPITLELLSTLLLNSYYVKDNKFINSDVEARSIPSAGALYPIDLYFHCSSTSQKENNFAPGMYFYNIKNKSIQKLTKNSCSKQVRNIFLQKNLAENSVLQIFFVANFREITRKYKDRGYRFVFLEAGHIAQNITLIATAMGLKVVSIGGYLEDKANDLLKVNGLDKSTVYILSIGF